MAFTTVDFPCATCPTVPEKIKSTEIMSFNQRLGLPAHHHLDIGNIYP